MLGKNKNILFIICFKIKHYKARVSIDKYKHIFNINDYTDITKNDKIKNLFLLLSLMCLLVFYGCIYELFVEKYGFKRFKT